MSDEHKDKKDGRLDGDQDDFKAAWHGGYLSHHMDGYFRPVSRNFRGHYQPWYDDKADYNTNAKSYYDYLARFNYFLHVTTDFINRLMDRDVTVTESPTIEWVKKGDWLDNGTCPPDGKGYDDDINFTAHVKIGSCSRQSPSHPAIKGTPCEMSNALEVCEGGGLYSPDYSCILQAIGDELKVIKERLDAIEARLVAIEDRLDRLESRVDKLASQVRDLLKLKDAVQKIVDNLHGSGAVDSNDLDSFKFVDGRDIATGNINLFGGTTDGSSFIRTNSGETENDITAGVD